MYYMCLHIDIEIKKIKIFVNFDKREIIILLIL